MTEYVVRFLVGGVVVSDFAMLGDVLRPKSFADCSGRRLPSPSQRSVSQSIHTAPSTQF